MGPLGIAMCVCGGVIVTGSLGGKDVVLEGHHLSSLALSTRSLCVCRMHESKVTARLCDHQLPGFGLCPGCMDSCDWVGRLGANRAGVTHLWSERSLCSFSHKCFFPM